MTELSNQAGVPAAGLGSDPAPSEPSELDSEPRVSLRLLALVFMTESMVLALLQLPLSLKFDDFAAMDQGANLTLQRLLDRGLTPAVDFGYQYGLLPLVAGRAWFGLLGRTPGAYAAAMLVFDLVIAWGLARIAHTMRAGPAGIALFICAMPLCTLANYINLAHAAEAALIALALADHAAGRRSRALAILTACLFVKPTMAYVYGFLLVVLILRSAGFRGLIRAALPAAAVGLVLLAALIARFGPQSVVHSLLPLRGAAAYKSVHYGFFFGVGRTFWLPDGVRPRHYIFTPAGHYLVGSVLLVAAAVASAWKLARRPAVGNLSAEIVACCGIMHAAFLTLFYGDRMSYTYYYYVLIAGLVALSTRGPRWAAAVALIAAAALIGHKDYASWTRIHWRDSRPHAETFGLYANADYLDEWRQVRRVLGDSPGTFITNNGGCMELFLPQLGDAEDVFLTPGWPLPAEYQRKLDRIAAAEFVLVRRFKLDQPPEVEIHTLVGDALSGFERLWSGHSYLIYRRRPSGRPAGDRPAVSPADTPPVPPSAH
ncbi:MAG: hypothetical protein ACYC61_06855 [Isosphaeraceae bacterium]